MPRKRNGHVAESARELAALERRYRGQASRVNRLRMLRMLRGTPSITLLEISLRLGCSERTVNRWLQQYNGGGLELLLGLKSGEDHRSRMNQRELDELRSELRCGSMGTLNEIQQWIHDHFGVQYSLKAVSNILHHRLKARRVWVIP